MNTFRPLFDFCDECIIESPQLMQGQDRVVYGQINAPATNKHTYRNRYIQRRSMDVIKLPVSGDRGADR